MKIPFTIKLLLCGLLFLRTGYCQTIDSDYDSLLQKLLAHSVNEVQAKDAAEKATVVFLDAREKKEYDVSHIRNAVWVGYRGFGRNRVVDIPKGEKLIVYCTVGFRSEKIAERLIRMGYKDVSNLYGGIIEWVNSDNAVYKGENIPTERVHTFNKSLGVWLKKGEKVYK